ncbi:MAG TPA: hypothetical protein VHA77_11970 [Xanthobacteraceae bacterium]|nr:hypothetical protein [Xanthobacteraceae bacterium]
MANLLSEDVRETPAARVSIPFLVAAGIYLLLLALAPRLLNDADTYWHIAVGRWILEHRTFPHVDVFSYTMPGTPWIAKEWLSQVLYAVAHEIGGWPMVVLLASAAIALAFGLLASFLLEVLAPVAALPLVGAGFILTASHLVARPHALALPLMVAWVAGLVRAVDRGRAPSLFLLPLMLLWANLHGGFTLGLALIVPSAAEALWNAAPAERRRTTVCWLRFAVCAGLTAMITPYGPESMLVTYRILGLGRALSIVGEWQAQDFSHLAAFEMCLLLALGLALYRGLTLPPARIVILLGILHLALSHVRNGEILGLLGPIYLAAPLAAQLGSHTVGPARAERNSLLACASILAMLGAVTSALTAIRPPEPNPNVSPVRAVEAIKRSGAHAVFNDYGFGGYLIYQGIAPFIDGRTELYGEAFTVRHHLAITLQNVDDLLALLDRYKVDATLLGANTPAVRLLDRLDGWQRVYSDATAVVHVRHADTSTPPAIRGSTD